MSLNELMQKITPLPWRPVKNASYRAYRIDSASGPTVVIGAMNREDAVYAAHAAKHLPRIIKAVKAFNTARTEDAVDKVTDRLRAALARAEKVEA